MNERMLELAKEAKFLSQRGDGVDVKVMMEKFGELIVRDCIDISTKIDKNPYIPDHDQVKKSIREMKKHFGVEE